MKLVSELRLTLRSLFRSPALVLVVVLTIALVICGVTLMTSVVVGALIDGGPYRNPTRVLGFQYLAPSVQYPRIYFPYDDYLQLRDATTGTDGVFDEVLALGVGYVMMTGHGEPAHLNAGVMPGRTFTLLGVPPLLGRTLGPDDDRAGAPAVIVLGEEVWRQSFGSDPDVVGRVVRIEGQPHEIVGVMPARFTWGVLTAWMPLRMDLYGEPTGRFVQMAGWLKAGVTEAQARDRVQRALSGLAAAGSRYPAEAVVSFGRPASPMVRDDVRKTVWLLLTAVVLLALVGCVNTAALLLARATARGRELSLRLALGASRWQVLRGQIVEVSLLGGAGAALGVGMAQVLLPALLAAMPPYILPVEAPVALDWRVLSCMTVVTALVCLACGLLPALVTTRADLEPMLRQSATAVVGTPMTRHVWRGLIGVEIAMSMALLVLVGVFAHGLMTLERVPLGYAPERVAQLGVTVSPNRYASGVQRTGFLSQAAERMRAVPGVDAVAVANPSSPRSTLPATFRLGAGDGSHEERVGLRIVSADFFTAFQIPVLKGRPLDRDDEQGGRAVAVVNDAFVRQHMTTGEVIGRSITIAGLISPQGQAAPPFEIVGVMQDVANSRVPGHAEPEVAVLFSSAARGNNWYFVVRAARDPVSAVIKPAQRAVWALDPDQAFRTIWTEDEMLWATRFGWPRFRAALLAMFGALSLALVAAGAYGIISYVTARDVRGIGIRLALGAPRAGVMRQVMGRGLRPAVAGVIAGAGVAAAGGALVRSFVGEVSPWNPVVYAAAATVLLLVTAAACYLPARRAARLDPLATLKAD